MNDGSNRPIVLRLFAPSNQQPASTSRMWRHSNETEIVRLNMQDHAPRLVREQLETTRESKRTHYLEVRHLPEHRWVDRRACSGSPSGKIIVGEKSLLRSSAQDRRRPIVAFALHCFPTNLPEYKSSAICSGSSTSVSMRTVPVNKYRTASGSPIPDTQSNQNHHQLPINLKRTIFDMQLPFSKHTSAS